MSIKNQTKRGDTIIEVMFAIAVFCLVAVISISMMDLGVASAEGALELVVTRNELNAQAEALRFIHGSYIAELTLPEYDELTPEEKNSGEKYQQYKPLWDEIVRNAMDPADVRDSGLLDLADAVNNNDTTNRGNVVGCERVYEVGANGTLLARNNAFVLNARNLSSVNAAGLVNVNEAYVSAKGSTASRFTPAPLGARIIYTQSLIDDSAGFNPDNSDDSTDHFTEFTDGQPMYTQVARAEGIWVIAVTDGTDTPQYYDFYIQSCWYSPNTTSPTAVDTVIRLYNPENVRI